MERKIIAGLVIFSGILFYDNYRAGVRIIKLRKELELSGIVINNLKYAMTGAFDSSVSDAEYVRRIVEGLKFYQTVKEMDTNGYSGPNN